MSQDEDNIPSSAKSLAPYIRSRQDALRIRQALTLYLQSHIVSTGDDDSSNSTASSTHLSLTVPTNANVNVKRLPADVTGVRKEYLKALQENIAVKREYDDLSDRITSRQAASQPVAHSKIPTTSGAETSASSTSTSLQDYLALLRFRRRHEKLQLFDIHLKELASIANPPEDDQQDDSTAHIDLDGFLRKDTGGIGNESSDNDNVQALIARIERTVIRARANLAKEQNLLKQLKSQQALSGSTNDTLETNKIFALQRTRDELVQWVEDKLATTGPENEVTNLGQRYGDETVNTTTEASQLAVTEYKQKIREQYAAYVETRKFLLDMVSGLSQPPRSTELDSRAVKKQPELPTANESTDEWSSIDMFQSVSEQILPAAKYQKSLALQRSYLAGVLAKEKTNLKYTLDRLSQESHLLPEYPLLARQSKFKHITSGTGSGLRKLDREGGKQTAPDDVVKHAQAWAFAADAARSSEEDYIEQKIEHGAEMADTASETLQQVYDILHQERGHETADDEDTQQENDIWTAEVQSKKPRAKRQNEKKQQSRGPWSQLNGRVEADG